MFPADCPACGTLVAFRFRHKDGRRPSEIQSSEAGPFSIAPRRDPVTRLPGAFPPIIGSVALQESSPCAFAILVLCHGGGALPDRGGAHTEPPDRGAAPRSFRACLIAERRAVSRRALNLARMLRAERMPRPFLERLQLSKLRALVSHAFDHVPAYRELWMASGVDPRRITQLADLARLPIIDKDMMRNIGPDRFIDERLVGRSKLVRLQTSGSSGKPFEFFADERYNRWRKAQRLRPYVTNGVRPWDRVLVVGSLDKTPATLPNRLRLFRERRTRAGRPAAELVRIAREAHPNVLAGYPSALGLMAREWPRAADAHGPRLVFTDSEMLLPATRARIRSAFGTDPIDVYGTYETDNIAFQCAIRAGLHVAMESVILEIVTDGTPAPAGEEGEVVVTVLHNRAMPFIRYNLHDLSAYSDDDVCSCGRTLPTLAGILGRQDDCLVLANGERCSAVPLLFEFTALSAWLREYRIVQRSPLEFDVMIRPEDGATSVAHRLNDIFARHVPGAQISITEHADGLPCDPSGKRRRFVSVVDR